MSPTLIDVYVNVNCGRIFKYRKFVSRLITAYVQPRTELIQTSQLLARALTVLNCHPSEKSEEAMTSAHLRKFLIVSMCIGSLVAVAQASENEIVTAKQVNGTWTNSYAIKAKGKPRYGLDQELSIWALGHQQLKIQFDGTYVYPNSGDTPNANIGFVEGIAKIDRNVAIWKPEGADPECLITLTFKDATLLVTEDRCGSLFGMHVHSEGTYKKTSNKRPAFNKPW